MARVTWSEGKLISVELRNGYALARMLKSPYLLLYDPFSNSGEWQNEGEKLRTLFVAAVAKNFLAKSRLKQVKVSTPDPTDLPSHWIKVSPTAKKVTLWAGTPDEQSLIVIGDGAQLVEIDIDASGMRDDPVVNPSIKASEKKIIDRYELSNIRTYPEFNERLALCKDFGRNVDPLKDLVFDRDIPREYNEYVKILAGG